MRTASDSPHRPGDVVVGRGAHDLVLLGGTAPLRRPAAGVDLGPGEARRVAGPALRQVRLHAAAGPARLGDAPVFPARRPVAGVPLHPVLVGLEATIFTFTLRPTVSEV